LSRTKDHVAARPALSACGDRGKCLTKIVRLGEWKLSVLLDEHLSATSATFATRATGFARQAAVQPKDHEVFLPGEG
jgi:hypothetical protein